ncbi:hypothetical protein [Pseudonocardia alaniniphila]|uniref:FecCD transport family protein n=1 Tax=Pseudonocardia alaniniphila TaxID=75291 RepID=A0ABS9TGM3_9PSEU|nr:hypothetical protein [Pseudonocardia alaniniphila]MCH6167692.1 hypothetical protein [Pseudonocardia alaniniphila]
MSVLISACTLLVAHLLAQMVALALPGRPSALPVGAVTALFGAPYFPFLIRGGRQSREA